MDLLLVETVSDREPDPLEEDVFQEESEGFLLSPLQTDSVDLPDTPVSQHTMVHVTHC